MVISQFVRGHVIFISNQKSKGHRSTLTRFCPLARSPLKLYCRVWFVYRFKRPFSDLNCGKMQNFALAVSFFPGKGYIPELS